MNNSNSLLAVHDSIHNSACLPQLIAPCQMTTIALSIWVIYTSLSATCPDAMFTAASTNTHVTFSNTSVHCSWYRLAQNRLAWRQLIVVVHTNPGPDLDQETCKQIIK